MTPAKFVYSCQKYPKKYFFRNKKIMYSEIQNQTLCTDKFILLACQKNKGHSEGPKFKECLRVEKKYRGQKF
jgi:5-bromo-4-chloroindolyl phosphate hydrolysis protein